MRTATTTTATVAVIKKAITVTATVYYGRTGSGLVGTAARIGRATVTVAVH